MPRIKKIDRPVLVRAYVPESLYLRLHAELYSELENRIPHGAISELFTEMVRKWLEARLTQSGEK